MSSKTQNSVIMQVVVSSLDEKEAARVQQILLGLDPSLSFSPCIEQTSLNDCLEFRASGPVTKEEREALTTRLCNDFDTDGSQYWAYGFNTKMIDPAIYYLFMEFFPE